VIIKSSLNTYKNYQIILRQGMSKDNFYT
jgi:hypothetical protein